MHLHLGDEDQGNKVKQLPLTHLLTDTGEAKSRERESEREKELRDKGKVVHDAHGAPVYTLHDVREE